MNSDAIHNLQAGERIQFRPRGHSMSGRINDGDLVTLEPVTPQQVRVGDAVLARVRGKNAGRGQVMKKALSFRGRND